ncbi:gas vesicle protein [Candidatus Poribacteria bacterium]|nr:gas vesicle protein [Candidatus Poribacteria bacterium]
MDIINEFPDDNDDISLEQRISLCELLDRVLNKGAVLTGEICISVAGVELLYIGLSVLVSSVETLIEAMDEEIISEST